MMLSQTSPFAMSIWIEPSKVSTWSFVEAVRIRCPSFKMWPMRISIWRNLSSGEFGLVLLSRQIPVSFGKVNPALCSGPQFREPNAMQLIGASIATFSWRTSPLTIPSHSQVWFWVIRLIQWPTWPLIRFGWSTGNVAKNIFNTKSVMESIPPQLWL